MTAKSLYPTIRPTLNLDFAKAKVLDPRITFTRASSATYVGSNREIKTASTNVPRFDYDSTTGESLGLLVEEARTNVGQYSEQFNQWTNDGVTVTANVITAPDGSITADLVTGTSGNRRIYLLCVISNGPVYTYSIFLKKNVGSTVRFDNINVGNTSTEFNFDTGVLTISGFTFGTVTSYSNGWYRLTFTYTSTVSSASLGPYFVNTNDSCYMWGYQFEQGTFPTSYIPTTSSAATRAADVASITGTAFSSWYNQTEGSLFCEYNRPASVTSLRSVVAVSDGGFSNRTTFRTDSSTTLTVFTSNGGVGQTVFTLAVASGANNKSAAAYKLNDYNAAANGLIGVDDTSATVPVVNQLSIGSVLGAEPSCSYIRRITYYPVRLPSATLQAITTP